MQSTFKVDRRPPLPLPSSPANTSADVFTSAPAIPFPYPKPVSKAGKRVRSDENLPPPVTPPTKKHKAARPLPMPNTDTNLSSSPRISLSSSSQGQPRRIYRTAARKLSIVLLSITDANWTLSEFLHQLFLDKTERTPTHIQTVSKFLQGDCKFTPGHILKQWDEHSDGRLRGDAGDSMYTLDVDYSEIKSVRPALSSFAAQKCLGKLSQEARTAVKPESGLHTTSRRRGKNQLDWRAFGLSTIESVIAVLQEHAPLAFRFLLEITGDSEGTAQRRPGIMVRVFFVAVYAWLTCCRSHYMPYRPSSLLATTRLVHYR